MRTTEERGGKERRGEEDEKLSVRRSDPVWRDGVTADPIMSQ